MGSTAIARRCTRCNAILAGDNPDDTCRPCQRAKPDVQSGSTESAHAESKIVEKWTGREARALREAMRFSVRGFAGHLGVTDRAISKWEAGGALSANSQAILDTVLEKASDNARNRFHELLMKEFSAHPTALKALIRQRHLSYAAFCREWDRAAKSVDNTLRGRYPAHAQYYRWLRGDVRGKRPYPDACRILEEMFPGWTVDRLFSPYTEVQSPDKTDDQSQDKNNDPAPAGQPIEITTPQSERAERGLIRQATVNPISEFANWADSTNISDGELAFLDSTTFELAHDCLTLPPIQTGERAEMLIKQVHERLRNGHQRLPQIRELYVVAGKLCAIRSWASSDIGQLAEADSYARNGWIFADQADHNGLRALLLSAQSKNEFWRRRYNDAAMHARRGYEFRPSGSLRVLLACQEADALQAMGRIEDAMEALTRSERLQDSAMQSDELGGIFGCGIARQANYSIATYLKAGAAGQALRHAERAEEAWRGGDEWAYGTWAQVQIGTAMAHLIGGEIEAAATILEQILDQPEEKRLATLRTRLRRDVTPLLMKPTIARSKFAIMLREGIEGYDQSPIRPSTVKGEL